MRTAEDARVNEALEEAGEDLYDAEALARRPGGSSMSLYHCAQAAEKYLGALAVAADRKVNPMWDLPRVFEAVKDLDGMDALSDTITMLAEFATPAKRTASTVGPGAALRALRQVRREVLVR
ncbi:MAG TPA: HEPN domain-containing protein, partial [Myxococcota bacterium]|nr:HEPN domain-containing protein [Myxococcota bacterium]